jgi:hypothetical protein
MFTEKLFNEHAGNRELVFTVANSGHQEFAANLSLSAQNQGLRLAILALDEGAFSFLRAEHPVFLVPETLVFPPLLVTTVDQAADFGSPEFMALAWARYPLVSEILKAGFRAIYLDTDVVIRRNFLDDIESLFNATKSADMLIQQNSLGTACTGVFAVNPSAARRWEKTFGYKKLVRSSYEKYQRAADQQYFNRRVLRNPFRHLRIKFLPQTRYPTGRVYRQSPSEFDKTAFLVHHNGLVGLQAKRNQMMRFGDYLS